MRKKIILLIFTLLFLQISIKPIKSFSDNNIMGIKYTIWDEDYAEKETGAKILYYSISFLAVGTISYIIMASLKKQMGDTKPIEKKPLLINAIEDVAAEKVYSYLTNENVSSIKEKLLLRFVDYKTSCMNYEYEKLKTICEKSFYDQTIGVLNNLAANNYTNISHTFVSKKIKVGDIHEEGNLIVIELYLLINYYDYIEDKDKNVIAGRKLEAVDNCYKIEYIITKNKDNITCLNCGKKVFLEKETTCPYCGKIVKIEAKDYLIRSITKC